MNGRTHAIVQFLEQRKSPFAVSRLIMMTGIKTGDLGPNTPDDPHTLKRIEAALEQLLTPEELYQLRLQLSQM